MSDDSTPECEIQDCQLQHALEIIELNLGNADYAEAWRRVYIEQGLVANANT